MMKRLPPEIENDLAAHLKIKPGCLRVNANVGAMMIGWADPPVVTATRGREDEFRLEINVPSHFASDFYPRGFWRGWWPNPLREDPTATSKSAVYPCVVVDGVREMGSEDRYKYVVAWVPEVDRNSYTLRVKTYEHGLEMLGFMFLHTNPDYCVKMAEAVGARALGVKL